MSGNLILMDVWQEVKHTMIWMLIDLFIWMDLKSA